MRTLIIVALLFLSGCSQGVKSYAPDVDPDAAGKAAVRQYDSNGDGKISGPELDKAASLKFNLANIDSDNDLALTADEIANRIRCWQTTKMLSTRTPIHCRIYHNRQPVAGAEIKLVPEKFLGDKMKIVKGITGPNGVAVLMTEDAEPDDPPGVGPGFYRVEITKTGENIPAKYNTNTILGLDTAIDIPVIVKGVRFDLEY
ncbi:MAG: hypothetical protein ABSG67_03430 [Thermoguttaceae bacterium]|jgi:hypothetical protein